MPYRIGEKVPFSKKGRYGVVHGSVRDQFFRPSHLDIETSSPDDVTVENINKLVGLCCRYSQMTFVLTKPLALYCQIIIESTDLSIRIC